MAPTTSTPPVESSPSSTAHVDLLEILCGDEGHSDYGLVEDQLNEELTRRGRPIYGDDNNDHLLSIDFLEDRYELQAEEDEEFARERAEEEAIENV